MAVTEDPTSAGFRASIDAVAEPYRGYSSKLSRLCVADHLHWTGAATVRGLHHRCTQTLLSQKAMKQQSTAQTHTHRHTSEGL